MNDAVKEQGADTNEGFKKVFSDCLRRPYSRRPPIFEISDLKRLYDYRLIVSKTEPSGTETKLESRYSEMLHRVIAEGLKSAQWSRFGAEIVTQSGCYFEALRGDIEDDHLKEIFRLLAFESWLYIKHGFDFREAQPRWFGYEYISGTVEDFGTFVVAKDNLVTESYIHTIRVYERSLATLGILRPVFSSAIDEYSKDVGWVRHWYRQFYEKTNAGQIQSLVAHPKRLDELEYWVEEEDVAHAADDNELNKVASKAFKRHKKAMNELK